MRPTVFSGAGLATVEAARSFCEADNSSCSVFSSCETRLSVAMTAPALIGFANYMRHDPVGSWSGGANQPMLSIVRPTLKSCKSLLTISLATKGSAFRGLRLQPGLSRGKCWARPFELLSNMRQPERKAACYFLIGTSLF